MFIEKKDSGLFLAKKLFWKKFLVKIDWNNIKKENIEQLTQKECEFIYNSQSYKDFYLDVYNNNLLQEVVYQSKILSNYYELGKSIKVDYYTNSDDLIKKITKIIWWLDWEFSKKFIFNSNNIEWSKIPEEEVEKIIENKKYKYKISNEIIEVENSLKSWNFIKEKFIFNELNIKKLYHILTKNLLKPNWLKYPRWFKKVKNVVNNNITTNPENVSKEILLLIENYKKNKKNTFPLQLAFDFHLKYEQIHPFEDWNWRTWRFLMNKILLQNTMFPMIVFKENKASYSNAISSCSTWNKKKYYKFMLGQYKRTLDKVI